MIEPLVRAVDDDLTRIRLAAPSGLVVNAYLLRAGEALALIDTGFSCTAPDLVAGLAEVGVLPSDLTHVFYTHTHYDHIGGGAALAREMTAEHVVPAGTGSFFRAFFTEAPLIPDYPEGLARMLPKDGLGEGVVQLVRDAPKAPLEGRDPGTSVRVTEVSDGDVVDFGGRRIRVIGTPGHDRFHLSYHELEAGRLYLGDVVLATPVPLSPWHGDSAGQWLASVGRVEALGEGVGEDARAGVVTRLIPGHGMPSTLVVPSAQRARGIFVRQYETVREVLRRGGPVHPVSAVEAEMGNGRGRSAQRTSAVVSTGLQILLELAERAAVERLEDGRFVAHGEVPPWEAVWPEGAK